MGATTKIGYIFSIWCLADPPIHLPKLSAQTYPSTKVFAHFYSWTRLSTKIWRSNPSIYHFLPIFALEPIYIYQNYTLKPIHLPKFHTFWKMTHPSVYISLSKPTYLQRAYVSMKICKYPLRVEAWHKKCFDFFGEGGFFKESYSNLFAFLGNGEEAEVYFLEIGNFSCPLLRHWKFFLSPSSV